MKILCVSDAHLFEDTYEREKKLISLLEREEYDEVILLGDIYDFWFEYRYVIPSYALNLTLSILSIAREKPVHYISGNHDAWIGDFWRSKNVRVYRYGFERIIKDKVFFFTHGDLFFGGKTSSTIRKIFHNSLAIRMFKLLHPSAGIRMARLLSSESRKKNEHPDIDRIENVVSKHRADVFITGHLHVPIIKEFKRKIFACVGDWMENFTYLEILSSSLVLRKFDGLVLQSVEL